MVSRPPFVARHLVGHQVGALALSLAFGIACERADVGTREVLSPSSAQTRVEPSASRTSAAPASRGPTCLVPMASVIPEPASPADDCPASEAPSRELPTGTLRFLDAPRAPVLQVERAETDADRSLGLMYRTQLDEDRGMLFSWTTERPRSFWMKNTCIPLDMLSIDRQGVILGILEQVPTLNELPRRMRCPASRVLEVNAGFARRYGIAPGQRVGLDF